MQTQNAIEVTRTGTRVLDGRKVSRDLLDECRAGSEMLVSKFGVVPQLAVVLVGDDPASAIYVRAKARACDHAGVKSQVITLPAASVTEEVCRVVDDLADDPGVHGIIVQLPLPAHIDSASVLERIPRDKDADGFHLYNVGSLVNGLTVFPPCTPEGVIRLLDSESIDLEGRNVVVVGASNIVGKPMAMMALNRKATVTVCHSKTRSLEEHTRTADVLICAAGQPGLITGDMVRDGVIIVDVGINRLADGSIAGDVDAASAGPKASYLTPVPGGVGPMTVSVLISNTVRAAARSVGLVAPRPDEIDIDRDGDDAADDLLGLHSS